MESFTCYKCNRTVGKTILQLKSHFRRFHNMSLSNYHDRSEEFICAQGSCTKSYFHFRSLARHLLKHRNDSSNNMENTPLSNTTIQQQASSTNLILENVCNQDNLAPVINEIPNNSDCQSWDSQESVRKTAAKIMLNLQGQSNTSYTAANASMEVCSNLVNSVTTTLKKEVASFLENQNVKLDTKECVDLMQKFDELADPFNGLKTKYQQFSYYKKYFGLVEPREILLGSRTDQVFNTILNKYETKNVPVTCQYVSIIDTLKCILRNETMFDFIFNKTIKSNDNIIRSYSDGDIYATHPFFQCFPDAVQIQFYYDDVETCNPLGTKTKIHELGAFYFTILNIPSKFNSTLMNIHLLALCHSPDLRQFGFSAVLKPFLDDLKLLESDTGIPLDINGKNITLRASIAAVCADSLACHSLFGFLSPSARYFCRLCLVNRDQLQTEFRVNKFTQRTKLLHQQHVHQSLTNNDPSSSGVIDDSILHESKFFHVTENFCFDAMHDLLEGVSQMELKLILNQILFIDPIVGLNIELLNKRVHSFKYGLAERKNKPSPNFTRASIQNVKDHTLKQKAAQMHCLLRAIPFIIFDKVKTNEYLYLLQLLLRIMQLVFSPAITRGMACYLEELVIEHHQKFKELFPAINLINKHHHMLHYADCMIKFGPLIRMWCMRYEAKHNYFKKRANVNCNFKNIAKSMANAHQLSQCYAWNENDAFHTCYNQITSEEEILVSSCRSRDLLIDAGYSENNYMKIARTVVYCGTEYRQNLFVCVETSSESNLNPSFGKIDELLLINGQLILHLHIYDTAFFHPYLNAFCIKHQGKSTLMDVDELPYWHTYSPWVPYGEDKQYLSLRHVLI